MSQGKRRSGLVVGPRVPTKPRPPASLELAISPDHDLADETTFHRVGFMDIDRSDESGDSVEFEQCRFSRATFAGVAMERAAFTDCKVEHCDWANLRTKGSSMLRVDVSVSRLTGLHWIDGVLRDVAFRDCRMDLATFRFTSFKDVAFVDCNLTRADFTNADLRGAHFTGCDLSAAQFAQADAVGARFTRCDLTGLGSVASLKGAVISGQDLAALSHTLAQALGIVIDDN